MTQTFAGALVRAGGGRRAEPLLSSNCLPALPTTDFDVEYGTPLGPAVRTGTYTWIRNFTQANVALDVQSSTGAVYLL